MDAEALERLYVYGPLIGWAFLGVTATVFLVVATRVLRSVGDLVDEHRKTTTDSETERHPT